MLNIVVREKRFFSSQADRKGGWEHGSAASALTVSKFDQFLALEFDSLILKHILFQCEGSQICIFHALYASAIPQTDHF